MTSCVARLTIGESGDHRAVPAINVRMVDQLALATEQSGKINDVDRNRAVKGDIGRNPAPDDPIDVRFVPPGLSFEQPGGEIEFTMRRLRSAVRKWCWR